MIIRKIKNNIEILLFFFVIIIDQISKVMIFDYFGNNPYVGQINLLPILNLVFVWNYGISFGIFNNPEQNQVLFLIISGVIILFLSYCYFKEKYINRTSISLIISGAIGNIIDRIHYGAVLDFIDFHIYSYHWPAFNIADSTIVIGGFLIIFFNEKLSH